MVVTQMTPQSDVFERVLMNEQIAHTLHIALENVKSHVKSLLRKTDDHSLVSAALRLLGAGWVGTCERIPLSNTFLA